MKKIINKMWLPVVTLLIIGAGVLVLTGAMRVSRAQESAQTVLKHAEAEAAPEHTASAEPALHSDTPSEEANVEHSETPAAESAVEHNETAAAGIENNDVSVETHRIEIPDLPDGYKVIPTLNEARHKPGEDELTYDQAGAIAVMAYTKVFGEAFTSGSKDIYVKYNNNEGMPGGQFEVYAGSKKYAKASFTGYMDAVTGYVGHVENHTPAGKGKKEYAQEEGKDLMFSLYEDTKIPEAARKLINEKFANGRTIEEIMVDGIQMDFNTPGVDILADCKIRMSDGDCYLVRVGYPTYDIRLFEVYPGWHSCIWMYGDESEAGDYPSLKEMGME